MEKRTNALRAMTYRDPACCLWCRRTVEWDPPAGPPPQIGDWHREGDYGCDESPSNNTEGTGGHMTLEDVKAIVADRDDAAEGVKA